MKTFVLLGAAGYAAPKHMKAIKDVGGNLIACLDPHDSVGILDSYFPDCQYFREFERFDRFCIKNHVDYCVVCSPNYLHDAHCLFGLRIGADVICEKPLVLNPTNLDQLLVAEEEYGHRIWNILQLRLSDLVINLKNELQNKSVGVVEIIYHTPRGNWYDYSWKANITKSGGIATNIGIHLFDLLLYLFGTEWWVQRWHCFDRSAEGTLRINNTDVFIDLSIEKDHPPRRELFIGDIKYDLSANFGNLHTLSYEKILVGNGFGIADVTPAITLCSHLRKLRR